MTLHTFNKSHSNTSLVNECLHLLEQGDAVLFIEDGVYNTTAQALKTFWSNHPGASFHAIQSDVEARGITVPIDGSINLIDYDEFVKLVAEHPRSISWY